MRKVRAESLLVLVLTRRCNQRCGFCPQAFSDEDMTRATLDAALRGLLPRLASPARVKLFGGEPLLRPDLVERAVDFLAKHAPDASVELPTNGRCLPAAADLLARAPWVEVFLSKPDAKAARLPGAVHNFLLPPGEPAVRTAARLIEARRRGFVRFNFLPAYFTLWSPAQLDGLKDSFRALRFALRRLPGPVEVVNLGRRGTAPLYNDGLVVDVDGEVYSSNLMLAAAVRPRRKLLRLGSVRRPGALAARAPAGTAEVLEASFPADVMASTRAADAALSAFCRALG